MPIKAIETGTIRGGGSIPEPPTLPSVPRQRPPEWRFFPVAQLVAVGQIKKCETQPSFHYEAAVDEFGDFHVCLPGDDHADCCVGVFARDHDVHVPDRLIASAKPGLCHAGVHRTAKILPWQGQDDVSRRRSRRRLSSCRRWSRGVHS